MSTTQTVINFMSVFGGLVGIFFLFVSGFKIFAHEKKSCPI